MKILVRTLEKVSQTVGQNSNCRRSRKLKALKGRSIVARGKREPASAPPRVMSQKLQPPFAEPRDSANLICGPSDYEGIGSWN